MLYTNSPSAGAHLATPCLPVSRMTDQGEGKGDLESERLAKAAKLGDLRDQ